MSPSPAISVVLPVYNAEAYVREAVESILAQSFTNFELIVIDDGSTDGSGAILRDLAARDTRIVLLERPNDGLISALNEGIERARADLIARMDADDVAMPERFALQHDRMVHEPELAVLGSLTRLIDEAGNVTELGGYSLTPERIARYLRERGCPVAHPTVMMRRNAVLEAGGYRKPFTYAQDYDLWLRISDLGYRIANLPQPLLNYRIHDANNSVVHWEKQALGNTLARFAHRVRKAGLSDPFEGVEAINAEFIQTVPAHLRPGLDGAFFLARHFRLSLAGAEELDDAWRQYLKLDRRTQRDVLTCHFLMRFTQGAVRKRKYRLALRAFIDAFRLNPKATCAIVWQKLRDR